MWLCVTRLLGHLADTLDAGAVQVAVVLARLDEPMALNVFLHLLSWRHKVIVSPIHLIFPFGPRGVCQKKKKKTAVQALTQVSFACLVIVSDGVFRDKGKDLWLLTWDARTKLIGELGQQVVIYPVFDRTQDDDGAGIMHFREEPEANQQKESRNLAK